MIRNLTGRLMLKLWTNPESVPQEDPELCPACGAEIPFTDLKLGTCTEGHVWSALVQYLFIPSFH